MKNQPLYIIVLRVYNDKVSKVYNVFVNQVRPWAPEPWRSTHARPQVVGGIKYIHIYMCVCVLKK